MSKKKELKQKPGTGGSNLHTYLKVQHDLEHKNLDEKQHTLAVIVGVTFVNKKTGNILGWLEWVCVDLRPFAIVESEMTRK